MKSRIFILSAFILISNIAFGQTLLNADLETDTYTLINSVFANPNRNVVETPDCNHESFGDHITQEFDKELKKNVFLFHIHVSPDNDRCKKFDRQRNEIKTYADSPENLKANKGETVEYKWKFKLPKNFKPSSSFTHIHQIKSVGGSFASIPMISLTLRKASPDRLELRYTPTNNQSTIETANLDLLRGNWMEVTETIKFDDVGSYSIEIKNISNSQVVLNYSNSSIDMWQDGAEFARPKWGIYRKLVDNNNVVLQDLQDEEVLFADFSIEEITSPLSVDDIKGKLENILLVPNPSSEIVTFKNANLETYDSVKLFNTFGKNIPVKKRLDKNTLKVSGLAKGLYFIVLEKQNKTVKVLKCVVE